MKELSDELLGQIVQRLVEALHPVEVWLFGSQASGKTHRHSDIDLLIVVADEAGDLHEVSVRGQRALPNRSCGIDLVVLRRSDIEKWGPVKFSLAYEATRKGRLVHAAEPADRATVA